MKPRGERYPLEVRFWRRVVCLMGPDNCWIWTGGKNNTGYGSLGHRKRSLLAHRVAYEIHHGVTLPSTTAVCHTCDNRVCVNPAHLWLGTLGDNNWDRHKKGRSRGGSMRGQVNPMAKLTEDDVRNIRQSTEPLLTVAKRFGISFQTVSNIRLRKTWRHVA